MWHGNIECPGWGGGGGGEGGWDGEGGIFPMMGCTGSRLRSKGIALSGCKHKKGRILGAEVQKRVGKIVIL